MRPPFNSIKGIWTNDSSCAAFSSLVFIFILSAPAWPLVTGLKETLTGSDTNTSINDTLTRGRMRRLNQPQVAVSHSTTTLLDDITITCMVLFSLTDEKICNRHVGYDSYAVCNWY